MVVLVMVLVVVKVMMIVMVVVVKMTVMTMCYDNGGIHVVSGGHAVNAAVFGVGDDDDGDGKSGG